MNNQRLDKLERAGFVFVTVVCISIIVLWVIALIIQAVHFLF